MADASPSTDSPPLPRVSSVALIWFGLLILVPSARWTAALGTSILLGTLDTNALHKDQIPRALATGALASMLGAALVIWGMKREGRFGVSIMLVCLGLLILVPSGLCTTFGTLFFAVWEYTGPGDAWYPLAIGAPLITLGAVLLAWGRRRYRAAAKHG